MRMMTGIAERSVPLQVVRIDLMRFGNGCNISAHKIFSRLCVVIAEPFRVLTMQTQHVRPYYAVVIAHLISHFIEVDFVVCLRKQSVTAELFHARTLCVITDKRFHIFDLVGVIFFKVREKLTRICLSVVIRYSTSLTTNTT